MKRCFALVVFLILILSLAACGGREQIPAMEPKSGPSSDPKPESIPSSLSEPAQAPEPEPEPEPEHTSQGSPDKVAVDRVGAMLIYLKNNLDPWDYSDVQRGGDGSRIDILTPFPETVKSVVEAYTGEAVTVEYYREEFSKGQLEQAKKDLEQFFAAHPEVGVWDWKPILLFGGYQIDLKEKNDKLTEFIESYPVVGIYQTTVSPEKEPMHPD